MSRATKRKLKQVTRERDEARYHAELGSDAAVSEGYVFPEEAVLPWEDYREAMLRRGGKLDEDE